MATATIFPTVIDISDDVLPPDRRAEVLSRLEALRGAVRPQTFRSLRGGHAVSVPIETAAFKEGALAELREQIMSRIAAMTEHVYKKKLSKYSITKSWVNFLTRDGFHHPHAHMGASWAAVYYAAAGAPEEGAGELNLIDPRPGAYRQINPEFGQPVASVTVKAADNRLVIFPAWLHHYVTPYVGKKERVAIAINIRTL